jgi:hypothetical protein
MERMNNRQFRWSRFNLHIPGWVFCSVRQMVLSLLIERLWTANNRICWPYSNLLHKAFFHMHVGCQVWRRDLTSSTGAQLTHLVQDEKEDNPEHENDDDEYCKAWKPTEITPQFKEWKKCLMWKYGHMDTTLFGTNGERNIIMGFSRTIVIN